jgi:hypothetical protein
MTSKMARTIRRGVACLGLTGVTACGDGGVQGPGGTGTTTSVTGISVSDGVDDDGSTTGSTAPPGTTSGLDETGDSGTACETIVCGDPASCCGGDEECVAGACLPICDSGVRCGEDQSVCCDDGQVCLSPDCVTPGDPCIDSYDCPEGEFCEPTIDQCLPQPDPVVCELQPRFTAIEPVLEWSFEVDQVITAPAVGDVDGDGLPEVVINTMWAVDPSGATAEFFGEIVVLDGATGQEQTRVEHLPPMSYGSYARSTIGIADVDGNGLPDIVYVGRPATGIAPFPDNASLVHAVNGLGQPLWTSHDAAGDPHYIYVRQGAVSLANFDDDDASEVVFGTAVLDDDGLVVFDQSNELGLGGGVYGSNQGTAQLGRGGISAIADLGGDGQPEIVSGHEAWTVDWDDPGVGTPTVALTLLWEDAARPDGYPAIADLDLDGDPEVVIVAEGTVRVLDGATGQLWCGIDPTGAMCAGNDALRTAPILLPGDPAGRGGPPTIADFDGDGRPEIAVAGGSAYSVYDLYRTGEDVVQPAGFPPAAVGEIFVRWTSATQDLSSNATGSSVFDFQGDGPAEVLYGDECHFRVYDGSDGGVLVEIENPSATIREYPIVVDVDDDGNSEIVVVANDRNAAEQCEATIPGYVARHGVFVYGDANDQWVRTRQVWTQHTYHVTNATSSGLVPAIEDDNWTTPGLNDYRKNAQGEGVFNAPDLAVDLAIGTSTCLDEMFLIVATVRNVGALGIAAGVAVSLHEGTDATGPIVSTQLTPEALLPGAAVDILWQVPAPGGTPLSFFVEVDAPDAAAPAGAIVECDERNNTSATQSVACPIPG